MTSLFKGFEDDTVRLLGSVGAKRNEMIDMMEITSELLHYRQKGGTRNDFSRIYMVSGKVPST